MRVSTLDQWAVCSGASWTDEAGFYEQGFARQVRLSCGALVCWS